MVPPVAFLANVERSQECFCEVASGVNKAATNCGSNAALVHNDSAKSESGGHDSRISLHVNMQGKLPFIGFIAPVYKHSQSGSWAVMNVSLDLLLFVTWYPV